MDKLGPREQKRAASSQWAFMIAAGSLALGACGEQVAADQDTLQPRTTCEAEVADGEVVVRTKLDTLDTTRSNREAIVVATVEGNAAVSAKLGDGTVSFDALQGDAPITSIRLRNLPPDDTVILESDGTIACDIRTMSTSNSTPLTPTPHPTKNSLPKTGY